MWWHVLAGVAGGLLLLWAALLAAMAVGRPGEQPLAESLRLLPDVVRLIARLARDPQLPRGVRWRLAGLGLYLALPIDIVPDFIPVLGQADDAIVIAWVLRGVARTAGADALARHWPGSPAGLAVLHRLLRLPPPA